MIMHFAASVIVESLPFTGPSLSLSSMDVIMHLESTLVLYKQPSDVAILLLLCG